LSATNSSTWISVYMLGCCVIAMAALLVMPRRSVATAPSRFDQAVDRGIIAETAPETSPT